MQPILKIDLTTGTTEEFIIPKEWQDNFIGGSALAARILYSHLTQELNPLSPDAPLLFLNGPLSGTSGPTTGRFVICGKSPVTNLWAESNIGGFWGPELRKAGYDGLWVTGKAQSPVYIWVNENQITVKDAAHLWGKDTYQTQDLVKEEVGVKGARVCVIGEAGENLSLMASIMCDHGRFAARTGLGALMGSKNLKAVAVHGDKPVPVFDMSRYAPLRSEANRILKQDNGSKILHDIGTAGVANFAEYLGSMPSKYFSQGAFSEVDKISGARMTDTILTGSSACQGCVIACGRVVKLEDGIKQKGPEYETIVAFGPNLLNDDLNLITRMGELCDRYGMDTISAGNVIGLAFMLYEKNIITIKDTNGLELNWGDSVAIEKMTHLLGRREGIGDLMSQGSRSFAAHFGVEEEAVQVNGLEPGYHDPRGVSGMALAYATSPRGACHNQSDYFIIDWGQTESSIGIDYFERHAQAEKAANVAKHQDWRTVYNSLVVCLFANVNPEKMAELINAACGLNWSIEDMMRFGERAWNIKRAINNRLGLTAANDKLPKAFLEPYKEGGSEGFSPDIEGMLFAYYNVRGWDLETGKPLYEKLIELGLEDVAKDLWG